MLDETWKQFMEERYHKETTEWVVNGFGFSENEKLNVWDFKISWYVNCMSVVYGTY